MNLYYKHTPYKLYGLAYLNHCYNKLISRKILGKLSNNGKICAQPQL